MILPVAAAPVAVLVLAWDETTPAVRALVEAPEAPTAAFDSVVVVVPAGPGAAGEPTQEEFLPLAAAPELPPNAHSANFTPKAQPAPPAESPPGATPARTTALPLALKPMPGSTPTLATSLAAIRLADGLVSAEERPVPPASPLAWAIVRILRLSSFSLPQLAGRAGQPLPAPVWTGTRAAPAAPYAGSAAAPATALSQPAAGRYPTSPAAKPIETRLLVASRLLPAGASPLSPAPAAGAPAPPMPPAAAPALPPTYLPGEAIPLGSDFERDDAPLPTPNELPTESESFFSEDEAPLPTPLPPAQGGWPEALAALQQPAPTETAAAPGPAASSEPLAAGRAATSAPPTHPALRPAASQFEAPNLNFQIIQYARFAVPVALAEPPFAVLYAPAWPTWLAAQELRQRTGRPLVLHVAALAAADGELIETATGWPAELQRQALRRADLILTETEALAARLHGELNHLTATVRVVPAADAAAIAHALSTAQPRPATDQG